MPSSRAPANRRLPLPADPDDIRGWHRLGAGITTSGRLLAADPARLAAIGVRHVINLALAGHPEALVDEGALLAGHGIGYTHLPVPFDAPGEAHFEAFRRALDATTPAGPVHVHCIMNWRVSAFFYRLHRDHRGMDEAKARALMARHWQPEMSDHPAAPAWAAFIAPR